MASKSALLGARGCAVDLVGQEHIGEDRPGHELEFAGVLVEDAEPGDVAGKQIGRALDPRKLAAERLRQGLGQGRLAQARQVFDEQVPAPSRQASTCSTTSALPRSGMIERGPNSLDRAGMSSVVRDRRGHHRPHVVAAFPVRLSRSWDAKTGERPRAHGISASLLDVVSDRRRRQSGLAREHESPSRPGGRALRARRGAHPRRSPANGPYQRARVSPGGRVRPAQRARRSISFKRPHHESPRIASGELRRNVIVASRSSRNGGGGRSRRRRRPTRATVAAWPHAHLPAPANASAIRSDQGRTGGISS